MDSDAHKFHPVDEQTRMENEHYALRDSYSLVRRNVQRLIKARERFNGDNTRLLIVLAHLDSELESLSRAPND
jgi:hypothetical protein